MELREYLRTEIEEDADSGFISSEERDRRLAAFSADGSAQVTVANPVASTGPQSLDPEVSVGEDDPAVTTEYVPVSTKAGVIESYVARPARAGTAPGLIVIHENRGLVPYTRDVARRLAKAGFVAMAPDLLSRQGGTASFTDPAKAMAAIGALESEDIIVDLRASVAALLARDDVQGSQVGVIGFCFGGGLAWRLATKDGRLAAVVPFYGPNPPLADVADIAAPVLAIYGAEDARINAGIDDIEAAMQKHGKYFQKEIFEGAGHAFHNDTNPDRYRREPARAAWNLALDWFNGYLRSTQA